MKLLLKQVTIADIHSPYNALVKDILVLDGIVSKIDDTITDQGAEILDCNGSFISPGWVDIFAHFNDPGIEYKETLETGASAAAAGGYTQVFVIPNTQPAVYNKSTVEYIVQKSKSLPVHISPIGAITKNIEGKELAEMYDMHNSGAIAFSDGLHPIQTPGLMLKAMQYVKAIDKVIIQLPIDKTIAKAGLINEGITSTQLGLPGIPSIGEELIINRDIELLKYTGSKLHIAGISTAKGLDTIKAAKVAGVQISCSVTPYHLVYCDEDLTTYDTNLKTDPPLRSRSDMMALRKGVIDGSIDCIATHHFPQDWDNKTCEFEYAAPGMIGLETAFAVVNDILPELSIERLVSLFSGNASTVFSLPPNVIKEGALAELTLFNCNEVQTITTNTLKSKCRNSPFIGKQLKGNVIGIINKDKLYLNS